MAKIPIILEAGRADGKLIKTNNVYDDNQEKFLSDKIKEIDDNHNTLKDNINTIINIVNNNKSDIENKLEAETNRAITTEDNLKETINNITNINEHAATAELITVNALPNSTISNVQQALDDLYENIIYDVSALNGGIIFESLSAILSSSNLSTLIPTSVRRGGMSIRFIQGSDNKYVQYRLMSDTFNTTVANWQGVDDEPIAGSYNLVKSGGVANKISELEKRVGNDADVINITSNDFSGILYSNSQRMFTAASSTYNGIFLSLKNGITYTFGANTFIFGVKPEIGVAVEPEQTVNKDIKWTCNANGKYAYFSALVASFVPFNIAADSYGIYAELEKKADKSSTDASFASLENEMEERVIVSSVNLVDTSKLTEGKGLSASNFKEFINADLCISDYILVNGHNITSNSFYNPTWAGVVYDTNKNPLRSITTDTYQYQVGDCYIRLNFRSDNAYKMANYGDAVDEYQEYNPIAEYLPKIYDGEDVKDFIGHYSYTANWLITDANQYSVRDNNKTLVIAVTEGDVVEIKAGEKTSFYSLLKSINKSPKTYNNADFANGETLKNILYGTKASVVVPSDAKYICITMLSGSNDVSPKSIIVNGFDVFSSITDNIGKLKNDIIIINNKVENIGEKSYKRITEDLSSSLVYTDGSVNLDGYIDNYTGTKNTYFWTKLDVRQGDVLQSENYSGFRLVTAYSGNTAIQKKGVANTKKYQVPKGITSVAVTLYKDQTTDHNAIIVTHAKMIDDGVETVKDTMSNNHVIRKPRITFIDDDGNIEFYQYLLPLMRKYNIPMVSAYMGDSNTDMHSNAAMMNAEQCKEVVEAGGEIVVHHNPSLTSIPIDKAEKTLLLSKNVLKKYGFDSRICVYSTGFSNPEIRAMVSKHFDAGFTGSYPREAGSMTCNINCIPQYAIHREHVGGMYYDNDSASLDYFKGIIQDCIARNGWLVFILHAWMMPDGCDYRRSDNTIGKVTHWVDGGNNLDELGLLDDVCNYIVNDSACKGKIEVVTASEGLRMFGNAMQSGDYLGYWNEMQLTPENSAMLGGHTTPGCAINKEGLWDMPTSRKVQHS